MRDIDASEARLIGDGRVVQRSQDPDMNGTAERRAFETREHRVIDFQSESGRGAFDAIYTPARGELRIQCRCAFQFLGIWPPGAAVRWQNQFLREVSLDWTGHHTFYCQRQVWEDLSARTIVEFVADTERPHFYVDVSWVEELPPPGSLPRGPSSVSRPEPAHTTTLRDPWTGEESHHPIPFRPGHADLDSRDLEHQGNQVPATHEGGHLLGLDDEYEEEEGTPGHSGMAQRDLGYPVVRCNDGRVMSVGMRIEPEHGVTFLAALRAATHMEEWGFEQRSAQRGLLTQAPRPATGNAPQQ